MLCDEAQLAFKQALKAYEITKIHPENEKQGGNYKKLTPAVQEALINCQNLSFDKMFRRQDPKKPQEYNEQVHQEKIEPVSNLILDPLSKLNELNVPYYVTMNGTRVDIDT